MENSTTRKNVVLEHAAVSGVLYVTIDKELLYTFKFSEHIDVQVVFDNNDAHDNIIKHQEQPQNVEIQVEEMKKETLGEPEFCEEDNFIGVKDDWTEDLNSDDTAEKSNSCQVTVPCAPAIQEDQQACKLDKEVRKLKQSEAVSNSNTKISSTDRKIPRCTKSDSQRNLHVGTVSNSASSSREENTEQEVEIKEFSNSSGNSCDETSSKTVEGNNEINDKLKDQQAIRCVFCCKYFKSEKDYACHHKPERKRHPCGKCGKVFKYKALLIIHLQEHHEHKLKGSAVSSNKSNGNEAEEESRKCSICGNTAASMTNLKLHMMSHTKEYFYRCCVCGQESRALGRYNKHMATHTTFGQKFQCKICKVFFSSRGELSQHKFTHAYQCSLCGKTFPNRTGRNFHYKTVHKSDILKCPKCGRMYSCKKTFAVHLRYHRNRHKTQCPVCGLLVFRLDKHMLCHPMASDGNRKSGELGLFVCDKCPKQFTQIYNFRRHMKIHAEEKPYKCTECPKRFSLSGGLNRHMVTHLKDKPFVCEVCGKACNQRGNLRVHMKTHKESKVVQCSQCGLEFTDEDALQQHTDKEHPQVHVLQPPEPYFQTNSIYQTSLE